MKRVVLLFITVFTLNLTFSQNLKPYILGLEMSGSIADSKSSIVENLKQNGIEVIGEYKPADDNNRWVIVFSSMELEGAVKQVGGFAGFAAALRIALTKEGSKVLVSYTNPAYWGNAYYRDDFDKVSSKYKALNTKLEKAMKASGIFKGTSFGSEKGISTKELRKYHYMMGMPYFDDTVELEEFNSHKEAIAKIESNLKKGVPNVKQVYKKSFPEKDITLYGFALSGEDGESKFMPIIDLGNPKHTAFLPYEVLVVGKEVHILHGRYRIALSFPDLTMGTFSKIMSTPGNIEDLLVQLVK